jgi:hypothetical protein
MTEPRIPLDPDGYAVNPVTGTVHTRYPKHDAGLHFRTRTVKGVLHYLAGREPIICATCYANPVYPAPPPTTTPQHRRSGTKRKAKVKG